MAVSQATTAVQIAVSANEPATGTSSESVWALLRTTISGTTPIASTPSKPSSRGSVTLATSPASNSGPRLRIAANSTDNTERACPNDILFGIPRS